jgi:hypothetical protein
MNKQFAVRFLMLFILFNFLLFAVGCSTAWVTEAQGIIGALVPAVEGILVILAGLGAKALTPDVWSSVQAWGTTAESDLQNVVAPLIDEYNSALPADQPGILTEIETVLTTITNNLNTILPTLKVTDPATQAKVDALVTEVSDEFQALVALIPVIKNSPTMAAAFKALAVHPMTEKLKSAKQFKHDYNARAAEFGEEYKNWIK